MVLFLLMFLSATVAVYNIVVLLDGFLPVVDVAEGFYEEFVDTRYPGDSPEVRDMARILLNASYFFFLALLAGLIAIPIRYVWLIFRSRLAHPRTYGQIQLIAVFQLIFESVNFVVWWWIFGDPELETVGVAPNFGLNILLAPAIMLMLRHRAVREYFSAYKIERAPDAPLPQRALLPGEVAIRAVAGPGPEHVAPPPGGGEGHGPASAGPETGFTALHEDATPPERKPPPEAPKGESPTRAAKDRSGPHGFAPVEEETEGGHGFEPVDEDEAQRKKKRSDEAGGWSSVDEED